ncbi:condensation domain-containing protein [Streptomyces griseiscabiei]|uniref:Condensation domain-containing protein n=1 Tax=Streptomyces griseiscabiei TaxID=2993540 RepID=A0ABU4LDK8_9ACTN|nr:condensation domain-containing protein [Streptomyces griseiscabiei]MBZ3906737.1 hypothetical protein [Streptomyces griseiscabiei]MDX2913802.1 condensation domain-containing protein [Streptomyces griseiscabiei]
MSTDRRTRQFMDFSGAGSGTYDLTWSQKQVCSWMEQAAPHIANMNLAGLIEVGGGISVDDVIAALRVVVERHEALRTRVHLDPTGTYRQVVHSGGRLPVDVRECLTDDEAEAEAELAEIKSLPFTSVEWPLRVSVLVSAGEVVKIAVCVSHIATDGWGMGVLHGELTGLLSRDAGARKALLEKPVRQPREQAAWERTHGDSATRRAEIFSAGQLKHFPNQRFPLPRRAPESPRFPEIMMESSASAVAVARLAEDVQVTPHTVVVGAISVLLSALSRSDRATFRIFCANRLDKATQSSLGSFYQVVPVSVEVGDLPFREVVRTAWKKTMGAYLLGPGDPVRLDALAEAVVRERGVKPDLECFVNLHNLTSPAALEAACGVGPGVREATRTWRRGGNEIWEPGKFYLDVWNVAEKLVVSLWGDTELFPSDALADVLASLEEILVRGADDSELGAAELIRSVRRLPGAPVRGGLEYVDPCWVDLAEVRQAMAECLSPHAIEVALEPGADPSGASIVAYLDLGGRNLTPTEIHRLVVAGLRGRRFVRAPHRYVIRDRSPDGPASPEEHPKDERRS